MKRTHETQHRRRLETFKIWGSSPEGPAFCKGETKPFKFWLNNGLSKEIHKFRGWPTQILALKLYIPKEEVSAGAIVQHSTCLESANSWVQFLVQNTTQKNKRGSPS